MSYEYLSHHGVKNQKWGQRRFQNKDGSLTPLGRIRYGVGRYQNKDGSLTRVGKKVIRKDIEKNKIPEKYKAYRKANEKYYDNSDKSDMQNELLSDLIKTKHAYDMSVYRIANDFLNNHGNKRVTDVRELTAKGEEEVKKLLKDSEKDMTIWDKNVSVVRRANAYETEKNFNDLKLNRDITKEIDRAYNKKYSEGITTSETTKESKNRYERYLKEQMKKNKKNGYY